MPQFTTHSLYTLPRKRPPHIQPTAQPASWECARTTVTLLQGVVSEESPNSTKRTKRVKLEKKSSRVVVGVLHLFSSQGFETIRRGYPDARHDWRERRWSPHALRRPPESLRENGMTRSALQRPRLPKSWRRERRSPPERRHALSAHALRVNNRIPPPWLLPYSAAEDCAALLVHFNGDNGAQCAHQPRLLQRHDADDSAADAAEHVRQGC